VAHITTDELFQYALPPEIVFAPGRSDPGTVSEPVAGGSNAGLGTLSIGRGSPGKGGSNPRAAWSVKVRCMSGGELAKPGVINLSTSPTFAVSIDNGTTYGPALEPAEDKPTAAGVAQARLSHERTGLVLIFANAAAGAAVTFGSGNSALVVTPKQAGLSLAIASGSTLGVAFDRESGEVTLTRTTATTATLAAAALNDSGLDLSATAGGTGAGIVATASRTSVPMTSFTAGDVWTMTTTASPDATLMCAAASDAVDEALGDSYALPVAGVGFNVKLKIAKLARWEWICKLGLQGKTEVAGLEPKDVWRWMENVADGTYRVVGTEDSAGAVSFVDRVTPPDPFALARDGGSGIPI